MRNIKHFLAILLVSLLVFTVFAPFGTAANASINTTKMVNTAKADASFLEKIKNSTAYFDIIVQLKNEPLAKYYNKNNKTYSVLGTLGKSISNIARNFDANKIVAQQTEFDKFAKTTLSNYTQVGTTSIAFNGEFLRVKGEEIAKLLASPLVAHIYASRTYQPLDVYSEKAIGIGAAAASGVNLTGVSDGTGLKFGVIDTGVDYTHPDLGGDGSTRTFPNAKVVGGYDFADNDADPYPDIADYGHGTHVAGIMAADGVVKGIAPKALIYAYKVFSSKNGAAGASDASIIAALEQAIKDGCDVINMSLGSNGGTADNPETEAINNATMAGIIVVVAAGNSGPKIPQSEFPIGSPSTSPNAISVAATNDGPYTDINIVSPEESTAAIEGNYFDVSPKYEYGKAFSVVDCGYGTVAEIQAANVMGKIALIERGPVGDNALYYRDKVLNAMKAGAVGTIIYNHSPGEISATLVVTPTDADLKFIPSIVVTQGSGLYLKSLAKEGLTVEVSANSNKGTIAEFSSMGVTSDFEFKPDVSAPGENIYSTYYGNTSRYATLSGTSMAAPCVAAVAGLLKKAHADWTPEELRLALANTSTVLSNPANNEVITWTLQGAGRINVPGAVDTNTFAYTTTKVDAKFEASGMLGRFASDGTFSQKVFVNNTSNNTIAYKVSFAWTSKVTDEVTYALATQDLSVEAKNTAAFDISFTDKSKANTSYEGIINITGGTEALHIPVILWNGEVKVNKQVDKVAIAKAIFNPAVDKTDKISFSLGYGSVTVYNGDYSASNLVPSTVIRVYDNTETKLLGTIFSKEILFMGDYEFAWDGKNTAGNWFLKDGDYILRVSVLEGNNDTKNLQIVEKDYATVAVKIVGTLDNTTFIYPTITGTPKTNWFTVINVDMASKISLNHISGQIMLDKNILKYDKVIEGDLITSKGGAKLTTSYDETTGILKFNIDGKVEGEGTLLALRVNVIGSGTITTAIEGLEVKDIADNSVNWGTNEESSNTIMATKDWDVNGDRIVDIRDMLIITRAYGYTIGNSNYCPEADINKDGTIDNTDLSLMTEYFGQVYP